MHHRRGVVSFGVVVLLACSVFSTEAKALSQSTVEQWGRESLAQLAADFRLSNGYYAQSLASNGRFPAYVWGQGIYLSALTAAARVDSAYIAEAKTYADLLHNRYWCWGYNASYGNCGDRYTDDTAWIVLALMELYEISGDATYLSRARDSMAFIMEYENDPGTTPDGGIRWHESRTCGANVCSTAPTCLGNLMLYQATGIESYLIDGLRLYKWLRNSGVQNASKGLYYQDINCEGVVDNVFLAYETGPVLQAAVRLYQITDDSAYLAEAQRLAASMEAEFVSSSTHAFKQQGKWGGHDMTNALVDLYHVDGNSHWLDVVGGYLQYLHDYCKTNGRYPTIWNQTNNPSGEMLDNASVARAYWALAGTPGGTAPSCRGVPITPYVSVNGGGWQQVVRAVLNVGDRISFGCQPLNGTWSWTGPASFSSTSRSFAISNIQPDQFGDYIVTYTNPCGTVATSVFTITGPPTPITPQLSVNGGSPQQVAFAAASVGDSVLLDPLPEEGGTWSWRGPAGAGFTSTSRRIVLDDIQAGQEGYYIATHTNDHGADSTQAFYVSISGITLFQHCNYGGWSAGFGLGAYTAADLAAGGGRDNDASSIRVDPGYRVTLYASDNFQGSTLVRTADDDCFVNEGWNDRVSSMVVEKVTSPVVHWQLNDAGGLRARDASGFGNDGTLTNMEEAAWTAGKQCGALAFDGADDYVEIDGFKGILGGASRTCTAWIKTTGTQGTILSWGEEQSGGEWMFRVDSNGKLNVGAWGGNIYTTANVNDGRWHHVAAVLPEDDSPNVSGILLYIDGVLQTTVASNVQAIATVAGQNVMVGTFDYQGIYAWFFNGSIDEVRIYNRALDAAEIRSLYRAHALSSDAEPDGDVDLDDFAALAGAWQIQDACEADLTCDCIVDMDDLMVLIDEWLLRLPD